MLSSLGEKYIIKTRNYHIFPYIVANPFIITTENDYLVGKSIESTTQHLELSGNKIGYQIHHGNMCWSVSDESEQVKLKICDKSDATQLFSFVYESSLPHSPPLLPSPPSLPEPQTCYKKFEDMYEYDLRDCYLSSLLCDDFTTNYTNVYDIKIQIWNEYKDVLVSISDLKIRLRPTLLQMRPCSSCNITESMSTQWIEANITYEHVYSSGDLSVLLQNGLIIHKNWEHNYHGSINPFSITPYDNNYKTYSTKYPSPPSS